MVFCGDYCRKNKNNNIMKSEKDAPWVGCGWVGDGIWPLALTGHLSRPIHKIAKWFDWEWHRRCGFVPEHRNDFILPLGVPVRCMEAAKPWRWRRAVWDMLLV